jgi:hypothetical protein
MKKSYSLEYNKTKECEILIFSDDLKFIFQDETLNL